MNLQFIVFVSFNRAVQEAQDIFGVDFNFEDFDYDDEYEEEEEEEEEEEVSEPTFLSMCFTRRVWFIILLWFSPAPFVFTGRRR